MVCLLGDVCRRHTQYPAFALGSSKVVVDFFFFGLFIAFVQNFSQMCMHAVIFSSIQFLSVLLL